MADRPLGLARRVWIVVAVLLAVVIAIISLLPPRGTPGPQIADLGELWALVLHGLGYALLAASATLAQRAPRPVLTATVVIGYGVAWEIVQGAIGLRSAQWTDVIANAIGALLGVALALAVEARPPFAAKPDAGRR